MQWQIVAILKLETIGTKNSYQVAEDSGRVKNHIVFDNQVNVTTAIDLRVKRDLFVS